MKHSFIQMVLLTLAVLGGILAACKTGSNFEAEEKPVISDIQGAVLGYLALPDFASLDFEEKVLPKVARFLHFDPRESEVYFTREKEAGKVGLEKICADTSQIKYARIEDGTMYLGPYKSKKLDHLLFRFPAHLLLLNDSLSLEVPYKKIKYRIDLGQLARYYNREAIYDAPALFELNENGQRYGIANHAAVIARAGEPSLTSFAHQLIEGKKSREEQYQVILDFVSEEIDYESITTYEVFFKPNEVLLRRKSDCSGKVVLYASLLEQLKLPYLLVYMEGHILVAVPGQFSRSNEMNFLMGEERYFFAETTLAGFEIGKTQTYPLISEKDIRFLQKAGKRNRLYAYESRDSLNFMTMEVRMK